MADFTVEPFDFAALSIIRVGCQLARNENHEVLIVGFDGAYRFGSAGNDDARYMYGAAAAAVAASDATAAIFDFRRLDYRWGDMLELVYSAAPGDYPDGTPGFAVVVGEDCAEAVRTLELGQFSTEPLSSIPWAHESIEDAFAFLVRGE